jgi:hypothetical protein
VPVAASLTRWFLCGGSEPSRSAEALSRREVQGMSRVKILVVAAIATLAVLSLSTTAAAAPPSCTAGVTIPTSSVNCTGTLTGLPPGITHVQATLVYFCVNAFHRDRMIATVGSDLVTDAHGNLAFNLAITVPPCPTGLVPVLGAVTIAASQNGMEILSIEVPVS